MKINKKSILSILIILILGIGVISVATAYTGTGFTHQIPFSKYSNLENKDILSKYNNTTCEFDAYGICTNVVDGDTIYVEGVGKIRFVGVNTPERGVEGYQTSKDFVKKLCLNKEVKLDVDDSKNSDKYGRTLAVVIVGDNETGYKNLNEILLKENLAEIMYIPPSEFNPYTWAPNSTVLGTISTTIDSTISQDTGSGNYVASISSTKFHKSTCIWAKKISTANKITFSSRNDAINKGYQACKVCNP